MPSPSGWAAWGSSARRCSRSSRSTGCARCASCTRGRRSRPTSRTAPCSRTTSTTSSSSARTAARTSYPCLVTTRNKVSNPRCRPWDKRMRNWAVELAAKLPITSRLLNLVLRIRPSLAPLLHRDRDEGARQGPVRRGELQGLQHRQCEPRARRTRRRSGSRWTAATSRPSSASSPVADRHRRLGDVYQSSPIALRFVQESPAYAVDDARRATR